MFPEQSDRKLFSGRDLGPGTKIIKHTGNGMALVKPNSGAKQLLVSSSPLQAPNAHGKLEPVDLSLQQTDGGIAPASSAAPFVVDPTSAAKITFTGLGIGMAVARGQTAGSWHTAQARQAQVSDSAAFFADVLPDTDAGVAPVPHGSELYLIARSEDAPERFTLALELPAGATLGRTHTDHPLTDIEPQTLEIVKDDKPLAYVTAPVAYDADGRGVPATMSIDGQDIVLDVPHRDLDLHYPLAIDPEVVRAFSSSGGAWPGWVGWHGTTLPAHNPDAPWGQAINDPAYYPAGLYQALPKNHITYNGNQAYFYYQPPPTTKITQTNFGGILHGPLVANAVNHTQAFQTIRNPARTVPEAGSAHLVTRHPTSGVVTSSYNVSTPAGYAQFITPSAYAGQEIDIATGGSIQNNALFGIVSSNGSGQAATYTGTGSPNQVAASASMAWSQVYLSDTVAPTWASTQPPSPGWTDDTATPTHEQNLRAHDDGLGLYSLKLTGADTVIETPGTMLDPQDTSNRTLLSAPSCTLAPPAGICPHDWPSTSTNPNQLKYTLPEGINNLSATAKDLAGNETTTPMTWTEKIDTPPALELSGTLYEARDSVIGPNRDDTLSITATDGSVSSPSGHRSGATEVTATLDGHPMTNSPVTAACTRPEGSCELSLATSLTAEEIDELDDGPHIVSMTASDAAGNTTPVQTFSFTYDSTQVTQLGAEQAGPADLPYTGPPTCSSLPPVAATVVDTLASLAQTVEQALQTVQNVLPTAINSSVAATTAQLAPTLALVGDEALSSGSLTDLRISKQLERGFALGAGEGGVCFTPTRISDEASPGTLASDGAMVFANSDHATTTILRPTASGAESLTVLNDPSAPHSFSWRVNAGDGRSLVTLEDGSLAIVNPHPAPPEGEFAGVSQTALVNTGLDQLEPNTSVPIGAQAEAAAVGDTPAELAKAHDAFARAQNSTFDEIVFVIPKPWAIDADGQPVPASMSTDGDTITLTVNPASDGVFPIIADPTQIASPARRGAPLRLMTFNTRSGQPVETGVFSDDPAEHRAHSRRVARVLFDQVSSSVRDQRVPSLVGLQEMCSYDLPFIEEELDRLDAGTNTNWRTDFQRLTSSGSCPGPNDRAGAYGNAIIRNVVRNAGEMPRFHSQDNRTNPATGRRYERRGYIHLQVDVRGRLVQFLTTHLLVNRTIRRRDDLPPIQQEQSAELLNRVSGFGRPRAAVGDFNNTPKNEDPPHQLKAWYLEWVSPPPDFRDVDRCTGDHQRPECSEPTNGQERIDYIFTRGIGINSSNVEDIGDQTSDYEALFASTQLAP